VDFDLVIHFYHNLEQIFATFFPLTASSLFRPRRLASCKPAGFFYARGAFFVALALTFAARNAACEFASF
jgi:hypothetical protein